LQHYWLQHLGLSLTASLLIVARDYLQAPTGEMQKDGTFMITNNILNHHSLSPADWDYTTFQYGLSVSFWSELKSDMFVRF